MPNEITARAPTLRQQKIPLFISGLLFVVLSGVMFYQQSLLLAPLMVVPLLIFLWAWRRSQQPTESCRFDGETLQFWRGKQCLWQGTLTNIEGLIITGGRNRLIVLYLKGGDSFSFFYYLYDWPDLWKIKALIPNNCFHDKPAGIDWNWLPDSSVK